jgi:hypothetical protein
LLVSTWRLQQFRPHADRDADYRESNPRRFFNVAVQQLADKGLAVGYTETSALPWAEIDDPGDLAFATDFVFPRLAAA